MKMKQLWTIRPRIQNDGVEYGTVRKGKYIMKATLPLKFEQSGAKHIPQGIVLALAILSLHHSAPAETNAVNLASGSAFAVLAGAGITVAGPVNSTTITGDIGTFPTTTLSGLENIVLNGVNHAGDSVTQTAKEDLTLSYNDAVGRMPGTVYGAAYELGGSTLLSGVYNGSSSFAITGALTLDAEGDPNAVWIFQMGSTLTTASGSQVLLINGAQADNIFWQVGSSATLGTYSDFSGNILAMTSITLTTGATVDGRVLARDGSVILDNNTINSIPEPAGMLLIAMGATVIFAVRHRFPCRKLFDREGA
jgi:hypothetical protein